MRKNTRRRLLTTLTLCSAWPLWQPLEALAMGRLLMVDAEDRFHDISMTLVVDAVPGAEMQGTEFFAEGQDKPFYAKARMVYRNREILGFARGGAPDRVRVIWREVYRGRGLPPWGSARGYELDGRSIPGYIPPVDKSFDRDEEIARLKAIAETTGIIHYGPWGSQYGGAIAGDYTVEVGSRIPQELIDDLRRDPRGALRLKFRLQPDGVLFGWDIERRPGMHTAAARQARAQGKDLYYPPAHSHSGGDFKEARPAYYAWDGHGFKELPRTLPDPLSEADQALLQQHELILRDASRRLWEKGWYIDKRTGQKIETDY